MLDQLHILDKGEDPKVEPSICGAIEGELPRGAAGEAPGGGVEEGPVALGAVDGVDDLRSVLVGVGGLWRYEYERYN
jgi:hypothetical protein